MLFQIKKQTSISIHLIYKIKMAKVSDSYAYHCAKKKHYAVNEKG